MFILAHFLSHRITFSARRVLVYPLCSLQYNSNHASIFSTFFILVMLVMDRYLLMLLHSRRKTENVVETDSDITSSGSKQARFAFPNHLMISLLGFRFLDF